MGTDWSPLWISLKTSILSTIITFVIGIFVSYIMANYRGKWKRLIDGLFTLPLILPMWEEWIYRKVFIKFR